MSLPSDIPKRYRVFLSYNHDPDRLWANWLKNELERYRVPPDLVGKANIHGGPIPSTLAPVFRDEDSLGAVPDLGKWISYGLQRSEALICLCSPRSAQSKWVRDELRQFKEMGKCGRVLALVLEGHPRASEGAGLELGATAAEECFAEELLRGTPDPQRTTPEGHPVVDWAAPADPIYADVRPIGMRIQGFTSSGTYRQSLEDRGDVSIADINRRVAEYEERLRYAVRKLAAAVLGVDLDTLHSREAEQRARDAEEKARRIRRISAIVAIVALGMFLLTLYAGWQRQVARMQTKNATEQAARAETQTQRATEEAARAEDQKRLSEQKTIELSALKTQLEQQLKDAAAASFQRADRLIADAMASNEMRTSQRGFAEGLAHLAQALSYDPADRLVRERFYWETVMRCSDPDDRDVELLGTGQLSFRVAFSPDGSELALSSFSVTDGSKTSFYESTSGQLLNTHPHKDGTLLARYSADGQRVVVAGGFGNPEGAPLPRFAEIWDRKSKKPLLRLEHDDSVSDATFDQSGSVVATAGADKMAKIWDAVTGQLRHALRHDSAVGFLVFSEDGTTLTTSCVDGIVKTWNVRTGKAISTIKSGDEVNRISLSPDGQQLIIPAVGGVATLWAVRNGKRIRDFKLDGGIGYAEFSPDGTRVLTTGQSGESIVWSLESGKQDARLTHRGAAMSGAFSSDGLRVLLCATDPEEEIEGELSVWSVRRQQRLASRSNNGFAVFPAWHPDGLRICVPSMQMPTMQFSVQLWKPEAATRFGLFPSTGRLTDDEIEDLRYMPKSRLVAISPKGTFAAAVNPTLGVNLWRVDTGDLVATIPHRRKVNQLAFSADETQLRSVTGQLSKLIVFDDQRFIKKTRISGNGLHSFDRAVLFSTRGHKPDEDHKVVAEEDTSEGEFAGWDTATGSRLFGSPDRLPLFEFRVSRDGSKVITTGSNEEMTDPPRKVDTVDARIFDAKTGKILAVLPHESGLQAGALNHDGTRAITATGTLGESLLGGRQPAKAIVWDVAARAALFELPHQSVVIDAAFSADGTKAVTASFDKTAKIWDAMNGKLLITLHHEGAVSLAMFSPGGQRVLTVCEDHAIRLWSIDAPQNPVLVLRHPVAIAGAEFTADGRRLVSKCLDGTIRLWDINSSRVLFVHEGGTSGGVLQPDGSRLVVSAKNGVEVWDFARLNAMLNAEADETLVRDFQSISALCSGLEFDGLGRLVTLPREIWERELARVRTIATGTGPLAPLALWLVTPKEDRPPWPGGKTTLRQHVDALIAASGEGDLDQAYELWPNHPLIHLALAAHEPDETRAEFLREFSLNRLIPRASTADRPALLRRAAALLDRQEGQEKRAADLRAQLRSR